jgi:hypothetical protein
MFDVFFVLLALLFIKHWYIDFVNQTMEEVHGKGIYGNWQGLKHSIKHGIATLGIFWVITDSLAYAAIMAVMDFAIHYHVDWAKININKKYNYTVQDEKFWAWLGADQLAHSLTYLLLVWFST